MYEAIDGEELGKHGWTNLKSSIHIDGLKFAQRIEIFICGEYENSVITAFIAEEKPLTRENIHPVSREINQ